MLHISPLLKTLEPVPSFKEVPMKFYNEVLITVHLPRSRIFRAVFFSPFLANCWAGWETHLQISKHPKKKFHNMSSPKPGRLKSAKAVYGLVCFQISTPQRRMSMGRRNAARWKRNGNVWKKRRHEIRGGKVVPGVFWWLMLVWLVLVVDEKQFPWFSGMKSEELCQAVCPWTDQYSEITQLTVCIGALCLPLEEIQWNPH